MARPTLRLAVATVVAVLVAAGSLGWPPPVSARPAAACPSDDGITVVVDFGSLGGGTQIRCVTQAVSSGFDALKKAGFTYAGTQRFPGLLCRIDGKPADDPCVNAPPPDRYWAYWTATAPGGAWTYSDQGAGNRVPPPGSVEGWAFSDGCDRTPGSGPCPGEAPTTTTTRPRTTTTTAAAGGVRVTTTIADDGAPVGPGGSATTTTPGDGSPSTTAGGARAPAAGARGDAEPSALDGEVFAAGTGAVADGGSGSAAGVVVGVVLALGLGGAGLVTARRRAREGGS